MTASNEQIVRRFLEARARKDYDSAVATAAEDVAWHSPVDGVLRGRPALHGALAEADRETERFTSSVEAIEARGEKVVATIHNTGTRHGQRLDSRQTLLFRIHDSTIGEVRIHVDDLTAVEAFWSA